MVTRFLYDVLMFPIGLIFSYGWTILKWSFFGFASFVAATLGWAFLKTTYIYEKLSSIYTWVKDKLSVAKNFVYDLFGASEFSVGAIYNILQKNKEYYRMKFTEKFNELHNKINELTAKIKD